MYLTIRNYQDEAADVVEQVTQRKDSLVQLMRGIDGFVAYYVIDTGNGGLATVSVFDTQIGVEESTRAAAKWVAENVAQWAPHPPSVLNGAVALNATR